MMGHPEKMNLVDGGFELSRFYYFDNGGVDNRWPAASGIWFMGVTVMVMGVAGWKNLL